jgi:unsaturated rhamnogalacturonyl hydrolase
MRRHLNGAGSEQPKASSEWVQLINSVNRALLLHSNGAKEAHTNNTLWQTEVDFKDICSWKIALSVWGAEWAHRVNGHPDDLAALESLFARNIDQQGNWLTPINWVDHSMKGYSLLYLAQLTNDWRYQKAADYLVEALLEGHPRVSDGSLPYRPQGQAILVDTLGMICPFLARYSNQFKNLDALGVSINQLVQFILNNIDSDTHLPYHGYYADGPKRLGMHAWGRGTGWYMIGLIETLVEMPKKHPHYTFLLEAYVAAARSLRKFQRPDGHWNWAILHKSDSFDSSTTSLVGYSMMRGIQVGLLDRSFWDVVKMAIQALVSVTRSDGLLDGALGECHGLGKYPQNYGPSPWLQGIATAFAVLYTSTRQT